MGTGKTTFGKKLAQHLNYSFIDTDLYIENTFHQSINQLFSEKGEKGFREIEKRILEEVACIDKCIIATGGGTACYFDNMQLMKQKGLTIYLKTPTNEILRRLITGKMKRPLLKDKTAEEIEAFINDVLPKREVFYLQADLIIDVYEEKK